MIGEVSGHKLHRDQYHHRLDDFSQNYSTRRISKEKYNSGLLQQDFPVEKLALNHQGGSKQRKRRE
ncbi:unnamed protein product [Thlaspi arvense]|uniref:Uncharacterized protein n=1 Tax=Thlaspi arvense TaxID=13288 RepID=A0AAU9RP87_THLAR|nr:unnamed protein product [Thlaspi arvense]